MTLHTGNWTLMVGALLQLCAVSLSANPITADQQNDAAAQLKKLGVSVELQRGAETNAPVPSVSLGNKHMQDGQIRQELMEPLRRIGPASLSCGSPLTDLGMKQVATLPTVRSLYLHPSPALTDEGVAALTALKELQLLDLAKSQITDNALEVLGKHRHLKELGLAETAVTDTGLASLTSLPELVKLHLAQTSISDAGVKHLRKIKTLKALNLDGTKVSIMGLRSLAASSPALRLTWDHASALGLGELNGVVRVEMNGQFQATGLWFQNMELTDNDLKLLLEPQLVRKLSLLEIKGPGLSQINSFSGVQQLALDNTADIKLLKSLAGLSQLRDLSLRGVRDDQMSALGRLPVRSLYISHSPVSRRGLGVLGQMPSLTSLTLQNLPAFDDMAVKTLSAGPPHMSLVELHLNRGLKISDASAAHLAKFSHLKRLTIPSTMSEKSLEQLRSKLPRCRILRR